MFIYYKILIDITIKSSIIISKECYRKNEDELIEGVTLRFLLNKAKNDKIKQFKSNISVLVSILLFIFIIISGIMILYNNIIKKVYPDKIQVFILLIILLYYIIFLEILLKDFENDYYNEYNKLLNCFTTDDLNKNNYKKLESEDPNLNLNRYRFDENGKKIDKYEENAKAFYNYNKYEEIDFNKPEYIILDKELIKDEHENSRTLFNNHCNSLDDDIISKIIEKKNLDLNDEENINTKMLNKFKNYVYGKTESNIYKLFDILWFFVYIMIIYLLGYII